jgi:hypothetical protein
MELPKLALLLIFLCNESNERPISILSRHLVALMFLLRMNCVTFLPHYALGFTQPLTYMKIRSIQIMFLGSKVLPVRRSDKLTAVCEPIVLTMWDS